MTSHRRRGGVGLLAAVAACIALAAPARADTVTDWNAYAANALGVTGGQTAPVAVLHLAMVHGAVYDAVNAIDRRYEPYLFASRAARRWYSKDAAAATAAYHVLAGLLPAQQAALAQLYDASIASVPPGRARDGGVAVGAWAAATMLAARTGDGRFGPPGFPVGTGPGQWRPTLPSFVNDPNAWLGRVTPFLIRNASRYRSGGPNPLTSRRYAREFNEVKTVGSATSSVRTADQTDAARYWAGGFAPWIVLVRQLSVERHLDITDNARLFAMLYLTGADAGIACWADKARWLFWRPITAIREAATDGNPATAADPAWLPLIPTPPYPDQPSGLTCFGSAFAGALAHFFGTDRVPFTVTSANSGTARSFASFSDAVREAIDARVWSGIHFRTADEDGARIGARVARYSASHYFGPKRHHHW
jgi:hypothetical protein